MKIMVFGYASYLLYWESEVGIWEWFILKIAHKYKYFFLVAAIKNHITCDFAIFFLRISSFILFFFIILLSLHPK
jgi:hypothetical protein